MKSTYYMVNDASVIIDLVSFMIENFPLLMRTEKVTFLTKIHEYDFSLTS